MTPGISFLCTDVSLTVKITEPAHFFCGFDCPLPDLRNQEHKWEIFNPTASGYPDIRDNRNGSNPCRSTLCTIAVIHH